MSAITITTKTSEQIDAEFEVVFSRVQPPAVFKPLTQADRLEPYRKAVMKQRGRGLTWKQIATGMGERPISEKFTEKALKKAFGGKRKRVKKAASPTPKSARLFLDPVTRQPVTPKAPAPKPKPAKEHLILDPVTGERVTQIPPPPPQPAAAKPAARSGFWGAFDRAARPIIRMGYVDDVADSTFAQAFVAEFGDQGVDPMNEFVAKAESELDRLTYEAAAVRYSLTREQWDDWREKWCAARDLTE
jgi:hypothetical protein